MGLRLRSVDSGHVSAGTAALRSCLGSDLVTRTPIGEGCMAKHLEIPTGFKPFRASTAREIHQTLLLRIPEFEPQATVNAQRAQGRHPR